MADAPLERPARIYVSSPLTRPLPPEWEGVHVCVIGDPEPLAEKRGVRELLRRAIRAILRR